MTSSEQKKTAKSAQTKDDTEKAEILENSKPAAAEESNGVKSTGEVVVDAASTDDKSLEQLEEKYIRLRAEYDNHIKRTAREKQDLLTFGGVEIIRAVLPILDDLRRTVQHARENGTPEDDPVFQGIVLVLEKFEKALDKEGVHPIPSVGEAFNPDLHEAMLSQASDEHEKDIVIQEFEPGYIYRDRVVRHAKVVVSG